MLQKLLLIEIKNVCFPKMLTNKTKGNKDEMLTTSQYLDVNGNNDSPLLCSNVLGNVGSCDAVCRDVG